MAQTAPTVVDQARQARERLASYLQPSPLVLSEALSSHTHGRVWLKLETQQPTNSFKVRPALNGMLRHLDEARERGVVTSSSGNYAQAVAYAARALDVNAQIVMMRKSSPLKVERTRQLGGEVVFCENTFQDRWKTVFRLQDETGRLLLHAFDSEETIAGDGTIGLELVEQIESDFCVVAPVSGGGLIAGIAAVVKTLRPGCRVIGVQPAANPSMALSVEQGRRVTVSPGPTLADALTVATPGKRTFEIVRRCVDQVLLVEEEEIIEGVRTLAEQQKLVVEPGGAVGAAALLSNTIYAGNLDVVLILSGGNILPSKLAELLSGDR